LPEKAILTGDPAAMLCIRQSAPGLRYKCTPFLFGHYFSDIILKVEINLPEVMNLIKGI